MLFQSLGLLGCADVVECSATDFITGYANQAGGKTRQVFESARGKVLFIDEAYRWVECRSVYRNRYPLSKMTIRRTELGGTCVIDLLLVCNDCRLNPKHGGPYMSEVRLSSPKKLQILQNAHLLCIQACTSCMSAGTSSVVMCCKFQLHTVTCRPSLQACQVTLTSTLAV